MYTIVFQSEKKISQDLSKIPKKDRERIFAGIDNLSIHGLENVQVKKLKHYYISDYRMRVGNYRILFSIDEDTDTLTIFRILHRSKLY